MSFDFTPGRELTDSLFVGRKMKEECKNKNNNFYTCFVDTEKPFDRVLKKLIE